VDYPLTFFTQWITAETLGDGAKSRQGRFLGAAGISDGAVTGKKLSAIFSNMQFFDIKPTYDH